ncbi:hypothetical protein UlMin_035893 [Ulmus minor]
MRATTLLSPPPFFLRTLTLTSLSASPFLLPPPPLAFPFLKLKPKPLLNPSSPSPANNSFVVRADDGDADGGGPDDYDMDDEELEEVDNKKDFDIEYDTLAAAAAASASSGGDEDISVEQSKSFVSTRGWDSETIVDYRINEEEFHKISLLDCDFFIRKPPDPDNDVYDFREMYVTPPDTDVYAIPRVLAPMPQKYIRCAKSDYGIYNVTEPPIDAPRDPLYKTDREIVKVFLTKHYRNRRLGDPEFVLDFEEIYVIDSKTKSITRAKVLVTIPEGPSRERNNDLLIIRDHGNSFKIVHSRERDDPTTVIEREEWTKTRKDMERHLSKLRDFNTSNWF